MKSWKPWEMAGVTEEQWNCDHDMFDTGETGWCLVTPNLEVKRRAYECHKCKVVIYHGEHLEERAATREAVVLTPDEALSLAKNGKQ